MKKNTGFLLGIFTVVSLLAIGVFAQQDLTRYAWELTRLNGRNMADSNAVIDFDPTKNAFTGNAGCNKMFGSYTVKGGTIRFSKVGTTKMFCAKPGVMKDEAEFIRALGAAARYSIAGEKLRVYAGKKKVLEFAKVHPAVSLMSTALAEKKWYLDGQPLPASTASPEGAFIVFDDQKGSAGGNTGCNVFGGSYKVDDKQSIAITEVISTMRACIENDRMDTERKFLDGLRRANRYDIDEGVLSLYEGKTRLLTFTGYDRNSLLK